MSSVCAAAILALVAITLPAAAQTPNCSGAGSQADLNACAGAAFAGADKNLNAAYKVLTANLSEDSQRRLRDAERAWLAFRDRECEFRSNGADGGSAALMIAANCKTGLTEARTKDIKSLSACQEGDLSCPR